MNLAVLFGKIELGAVEPKDYSDWAEMLLVEGCESESVMILASFGLEKSPDRWEVEHYFAKCVKELQVRVPDKDAAIRNYAMFICVGISGGEISARSGLSFLSHFWYQTGRREPLYRIWDELCDDISSLESDGEYLWNSGLTIDNIAQYITKVAKQFLVLCTRELPTEFFRLSACRACSHVGMHSTERIEKSWLPERLFKSIFHRGPTYRCICSKCGAPYPLSMSDYAARQVYLEQAAN